MSEHPDILPPQLPTFTPLYARLGSEGNTEYLRRGDEVYQCNAGGIPRWYCLWRRWEVSYAWRRLYGDLQSKRRSTMAPEQYPSSWQSED